MAKRNKRKKGSFFRRNIIALLFFSVLLVYLSATIINQEMKLRASQKEGEQLQEIVAKLEKKLSRIEKEIEESGNPEFVEKTAREKLKMVKPNEIIYIIQD
ncbi:MAG: septum formation initiator family protein [Maledivibacter sp.]|jgi:cell division protein FtsL|nr:septum formation initiator family protein [Maledivibacter sp.]